MSQAAFMPKAEAALGTQLAITILLSTYNGARFLPDQLASFEAQTHSGWFLLWRDDGSADETLAIMRAFTARMGAEKCREAADSGLHLGAAASFLSLLDQADGAEAVAFADQDDVWMPGKLARAVPHLRAGRGQALLYFARQYLVDDRLQGRSMSILPGDRAGFPASLTQNIVHGNTMVMNRRAAALVARIPGPPGTVHDWWSYIVVSACGGRIVLDPEPVVLYRQHRGNLIGSPPSTLARAAAAVRRGPSVFMTMMRRHVAQLSAHEALLTEQARADLARIRAGLETGGPRRAAALRCPGFRRQTRLEDMLFRLWFMIG